MSIGERIKRRRLQLGMTVDDIAAELGKNRATVYRYENDDIKEMPTTVLEPLAKILKTTPADLMGWSDEHITTPVFQISAHEEEIVTHYRAADSGTQKSVRKLLDVSDPEESSLHLMPVAAHAKEGASLEELEDDARMVDDD